MNLVRAYLSKPSTQSILKRKPKDKGFSLIELVVVIAVLAVLTAIALPNFLGVSEDASVRAAQQAALNAFKECKVYWARNKREGFGESGTREFQVPSVNDWMIVAVPTTTTFGGATTAAGSGQPATGDTAVACFDSGGGARDVYAIPTNTDDFSRFKIASDGIRTCLSGEKDDKETFNTGCDTPNKDTVATNWK